MEIMLKNKCCLYVIISIRFFSITICNLLIEFPSYITLIKLSFGDCYLMTLSIPEAFVTGELKSLEQRWNDTDRGKFRSTKRTTCQSAIRSATNPKRTDLESNTGLCVETKATNCLSHDASKVCYICLSYLT